MDVELAVVAGRVDLLLDRVSRAGSIAARRHALDSLARALLLADPGRVDEATREAALALRVDPSTVAASEAPRMPHAVDVPLVAGELGFVRQLLVTYDPIGWTSEGLYGPSARRACREAIAQAARDAPSARDPAAHQLVAAQPEALLRARVDGASLGAAAYVSAVSLFEDRPVRDDVVVTGAVRGERVVGVGAMPAKVAAALARGARLLVVPEADAALARQHAKGEPLEVLAVADTGGLRDAALAQAHARRSPEAWMREGRQVFATGWDGYRWPTVRETLARVSATLPEGRIDLRVEALTRLGAAVRHLGDPVGSLAWLEQAHGLVASELGQRGVPDSPRSYLWLQTAMTHRQLGRFADAARAAKRAASVARKARLRRELIKALGCVGLVAMSRRRPQPAVRAFTESLDVGLEFEPDNTARTHAYLVEAYGMARDAAAVQRHFVAAESALDLVGADAPSRAWVRTSYAGALLDLGQPGAAVDALDVEPVHDCLENAPLPGLLARRHLGVALCRAGEPRRGGEILAVSPLVHGRALEPHLSFLAHLNVLFEARERLRAKQWGPDIAGRTRAALAHVPRHGELPARFGNTIEEVARSLDRRPRARTLDRLLARCARLS